MNLSNKVEALLMRDNPAWLSSLLEKTVLKLPVVRSQMEGSYADTINELEPAVKPYNNVLPRHTSLPATGIDQEAIVGWMEEMRAAEQDRWQEGLVSGAVYHGGAEHIDFLNEVYALNSQSNPLHADVWPSNTKYEAEIVAMTAQMLGARQAEGVCGTVSSGGTESILLAMKTYRDWARQEKGIKNPELVLPVTAHVAFDKAGQYFNIQLKKIPLDKNYRADVTAARKAITRNTIALVGSAPGFPHGIIDPIVELSELARQKGIGFHTDACLGGFVLPWAERLGYPVPALRLPSARCDLDVGGYAQVRLRRQGLLGGALS